MRLTIPSRQATTAPRRPSWAQTDEVANPMSRYPKVKPHRSLWLPPWEEVWCQVTLADGTWGLGQTAHGRAVAAAPEQLGAECDLMLDCWMAFDVEYTVRLAEVLRPYRLRWLEECLIPEDLDAHLRLRERLPWQTLATGEHWSTPISFHWAGSH